MSLGPYSYLMLAFRTRASVDVQWVMQVRKKGKVRMGDHLLRPI